MEPFTFISILQIIFVLVMTESCRSMTAVCDKWVEDLSLRKNQLVQKSNNPFTFNTNPDREMSVLIHSESGKTRACTAELFRGLTPYAVPPVLKRHCTCLWKKNPFNSYSPMLVDVSSETPDCLYEWNPFRDLSTSLDQAALVLGRMSPWNTFVHLQ